MSSACWVAICIAVLFSALVDAASIGASGTPRVSLGEHKRRIEAFKCAAPQERAYKITKLLSFGAIGSTDVVYPSYTVIRTCDDGAGCCGSESKVCKPVAVEYEEVEVRVSNVVNSTKLIRTLKIQHHKECKCELRSDIPNYSMPVNVTFIN